MNTNIVLSDVTKKYLSCYYIILDNMMYDMDNLDFEDSISHNFIVQMIPHHRAAIEMSKNLLQYTTCVQLQKIALNIIEEQTKSIENMEKILCCCGEYNNTEQDLCLYLRSLRQITHTMFTDMGSARTTNNININFINEMIPHHKGAIEMSKNALMFPVCPELKPILNNIITSQTNGVREMKKILRCM